ncbi:hypothetical protein QBC32DRAFT_340679 [Pseudoneurospora amorphoporcata]|uniref:C2H2-type domain-containing protein n=1 Tax=Pseudoneurospora amorphoporcata TaxID=241081 RepID=A0AAN6NVP0_9PEZI|nr:hypothetical protein QBC32DRAFT_340679 [Pseudoneurospora amorphoporcata]
MKRSREPEEEDPLCQQQTASSPYPDQQHSDDTTGTTTSRSTSADVSRSPPAAKIAELDPTESPSQAGMQMKCSLPPHKDTLVFSTYSEYESHYNSTHTNRCLECRKNFPSAHLLGLHIEENHDSFMAVKRDRGEHTYSCFVEGCDRKCMTPQKRRMHLIDKHMYPKNFFFAVTLHGIDGRQSMLLDERRKPGNKPPTATNTGSSKTKPTSKSKPPSETKEEQMEEEQMEVDQPEPESAPTLMKTVAEMTDEQHVEPVKETVDVDMGDLVGKMSALQFVPSSVRFGRGGRKTGFAKS